MASTSQNKLVGIVLAGGQSSRMGRDKAALEIDGQTLLARMNGCLADAHCDEVLVSGGTSPSAIQDLWPAAGPVSALCSLYQQMAPTAGMLWLLTPVDIPLVQASTFKILTTHLLHHPDLDAVCFERNPLPLCLRINDHLAKVLADKPAALAAGTSLSIRSITDELQLGRIPLTPDLERQLTNVNTPSDWESIQT